MKRVVVTGIGLATPLGVGKDKVWTRLINGEHGIQTLTEDRFGRLSSRVAGRVNLYEEERNPRFINFALLAAEEAIKDSNLNLSKLDTNDIVNSPMNCFTHAY